MMKKAFLLGALLLIFSCDKEDPEPIVLTPKKPVINGTALDGNQLTLQFENIPKGYTQKIKWYRNGTLIQNLNTSSYTLSVLDLGSKIRASITYQKGSKSSKEVFSEFTDIVKSPKPVVVGDFHINDPFYKKQWYLKNTGQDGAIVGLDINIEGAWKQGYWGDGINVAVLDQTADKNHRYYVSNLVVAEGLGGNIYHKDNGHGTAVIGIIASKDDNIGTIGVAPHSKVYAYGVITKGLEKFSTMKEAFDTFHKDCEKIAVYNFSFTVKNGLYNPTDCSMIHQSLDEGVTKGFGGKGSCYVSSTGNMPYFDGGGKMTSSHHGVIDVSGTTKKGGLGSIKVSLQHWVSGFTHDIYTADNTDIGGVKHGYEVGEYNPNFGGTSAAAPMVSGVVALIRQANPSLTYRDVKLILAETANNSLIKSKHIWHTTGTKYAVGGSYEYNDRFGFGIVDATKSVELAKSWTLLPKQKIETYHHRTKENIAPIEEEKKIDIDVIDSKINFIEFVQFTMDFDIKTPFYFQRFANTSVIDPNGKEHTLIHNLRFFVVKLPTEDEFKLVLGYSMYLGRHSPNGVWKFKIKDQSLSSHIRSVNNVTIKIYGH